MERQELLKKQLPEPPSQAASRQAALWLPAGAAGGKHGRAVQERLPTRTRARLPDRQGVRKSSLPGTARAGTPGEFHLLSSAGWAASPLQAHWLLLPHFRGSSRNSQQQGLSKLPPHQHDLRAAAGKGRGRSKGESVTASGDPRGSTSAAVRNGDTVRTKGQERPSPQQCQEPPTGQVLMKTQFSVCTLGGLIPLAEFRWAVKRPNFIPGPNLIPSGFKQCFPRAHGSHRGDARLLKEASAAHRAKQGGKGTVRSPPQPRGPRPLCAANVL